MRYREFLKQRSMAKAKIGGLRSIVHGRVGADIYQIGRSGAGTKQQVVRSMPEEVTNPQSITQMQQRMILATVAAAFKLLKPIINHSFDGVTAGIASISAFRKMNFPLLRDYVLNDAPDGYQFALNEWQERAALCGAYVVANGAKRLNTWVGGGWKIEPGTSDVFLELLVDIPVKDNKVYLSDFKQAWQVGPDGIVTVVGIVATGQHSSRLGYYQLRIKQGLADNTVLATFPSSGDEPTSKVSVADIFDVDANLDPYIYMFCVRDADTQLATIGPKMEGIQDADAQGGAFALIGAWKTAKGYAHNYARLDCSLSGSAHYRDNAQVLATYPVGQTPFLDGGNEFPHVEPITPEPPAPTYPNKFTVLTIDGIDALDESDVVDVYSTYETVAYRGEELNGCYCLCTNDNYSVGDEIDISSLSSQRKKQLTANSGSLSSVIFNDSGGRLYLYKDGVIVGRYGKGVQSTAPADNPVLETAKMDNQSIMNESSMVYSNGTYPTFNFSGQRIRGTWFVISVTEYNVGDTLIVEDVDYYSKKIIPHNSTSLQALQVYETVKRCYIVNGNKVVNRLARIAQLSSD